METAISDNKVKQGKTTAPWIRTLSALIVSGLFCYCTFGTLNGLIVVPITYVLLFITKDK